MQNGFLENFNLPEVAVEAFAKKGVKEVSLDDGVQRLMSGHDQGLAYRFFRVQIRNKIKSDAAKFPVHDSVDMIEWLKSRKAKPVERVRMLPPELLAFDDEGECVGGRYAESFRRYKQGLSAPGTPLTKWGELDDGAIASLAELGIFSVEQFAAQPREKIQSKFPLEYIEKFDLAIEYVSGSATRASMEETGQRIAQLELEKQAQAKVIAEMQAQMASLMAMQGAEGAPKKRGRKAKEETNGD